MWCLIDHANGKTGLAYPSEERMARILDLPLQTIERNIRKLKRQQLLRIVRRKNKNGSVSNRYYINWQPLFDAYRDMKRASKVTGPIPSKVMVPTPSKLMGKPMDGEPSDRNLGHEMASPPSASDASAIKDMGNLGDTLEQPLASKEAFSKEATSSDHPESQPSEKLMMTFDEWRRRRAQN